MHRFPQACMCWPTMYATARHGMGNEATGQAHRFRLLVLANYVGWGHNMDSLFWELYQAIVHHRAFMIDSR